MDMNICADWNLLFHTRLERHRPNVCWSVLFVCHSRNVLNHVVRYPFVCHSGNARVSRTTDSENITEQKGKPRQAKCKPSEWTLLHQNTTTPTLGPKRLNSVYTKQRTTIVFHGSLENSFKNKQTKNTQINCWMKQGILQTCQNTTGWIHWYWRSQIRLFFAGRPCFKSDQWSKSDQSQ